MKTFSKIPAETGFNEVRCALCGSDRNKPLWPDNDILFVKCVDCGLVFQNPQPDSDQLLGRYDEEYFDYEIENENTFFNLMDLGLKDIGFYEIESRLLSEKIPDNEAPLFLDIGCATGKLIFNMKKRGWAVKGVEVCEPAARYGIKQHGLDIHIGTLETAVIADSSVDVIHCSHLIEHLVAPEKFVEEAARILKPGGLFIIVTPDISGFQARLFKSQWRSAIADHMYLFSKKTLSGMLKNYGFSILKSVSWGGLAVGTAPAIIKKIADKLVKRLGTGDVICIMGMIQP